MDIAIGLIVGAGLGVVIGRVVGLALVRRMRQRDQIRRLTQLPPSFEEFEAVVGRDSRSVTDPFQNDRLYDLMCQAMAAGVYDRDGAFKRLHKIAESKALFAQRSA